MIVVRGRHEPEIPSEYSRTVVLGMFDGVHIGHQSLLAEAKKHGHFTVVTFENHPFETLGKKAPAPILTLNERIAKLSDFKPVAVWLRNFTFELSEMSWKGYAAELAALLNPKRIIMGYNHTFGKNAKGTPEKLAAAMPDVDIIVMPPVTLDGESVSSTGIRSLICEGNIEKAGKMLGRPFEITGQVEHGMRVGRTLGFKTANITPPQKLLPAFGVYIAEAEVDGSVYGAVVNVGVRPTVSGKGITVEAHLLDVELNDTLYEKNMTARFLRMVRPEIEFENLDALKDRICHDISTARDYFSADNLKNYAHSFNFQPETQVLSEKKETPVRFGGGICRR